VPGKETGTSVSVARKSDHQTAEDVRNTLDYEIEIKTVILLEGIQSPDTRNMKQ
jgi:hypothetical protein